MRSVRYEGATRFYPDAYGEEFLAWQAGYLSQPADSTSRRGAARPMPEPSRARSSDGRGSLIAIEGMRGAGKTRAQREGWLGEIEGLDLTLSHLRRKREQTRRLARATGLVEVDGPDRERTTNEGRPGSR
jgi:hypothetical protein